jgi:dolichol-phosphate mannosyltransferase
VSEEKLENSLISVVVPVFDEQECIEEFVSRARAAMATAGVRHEIIFVDDGSRDGTADVIASLRERDPAIKSIRFSRNFGHQAALVAGLAHASGDAVVTMDGDLQHPPECLPGMIELWRRGAEVVSTGRQLPAGQSSSWKERTSRFVYRIMTFVSAVPVVPASADFRLMDRKAVAAFNSLDEHFLFVRGLIPWLGFREAHFEYEVEERFGGHSKYSLTRQFRLALDGIFSFSVVPLRLISLLGLVTTILGICFGIFSVISYFLGRVEDGGWTSVVVLILVFGGVQLLSLGIVSEYIGRTYEEVKRRPRYVISSMSGIDDSHQG